MKMPRMSKILSDLDDDLILEAEDYKPKPKFGLGFKQATMILTCLVMIVFISIISIPKTNVHHNRPVTSLPPVSNNYVSYDGKDYVYDGLTKDVLDSEYVFVAEVFGDDVYASKDKPEEIYIYTSKFNEDSCYVRFVLKGEQE